MLRCHPRKFGFVDIIDDDSVFVPPSLLAGFVSDDLVNVTFREDGDGRRTATAVELVRRQRRFVAGVVKSNVETVPARVTPDPFNVRARDGGAVTILSSAVPVGAAGQLRAGLNLMSPTWVRCGALSDAYGLISSDHVDPDELERIITAAFAGVDHHDQTEPLVAGSDTGRVDLRGVPAITVDGASTRDLDDAITVTRAGDGWQVMVHIADASHHVGEGTRMNRAAVALGSTVYLAGGKIPMLPSRVSEDAASLLAGLDRRAVTVRFDVNADGTVSGEEIFTSWVNVSRRLTYQRAEQHLDGIRLLPGPEGQMLTEAANVTDVLRRVRAGRDTLEGLFTTVEWEPTVDNGRVRSERVVTFPKAENLIEELMIAANETVGRWCVAEGLTVPFRTQPAPDVTVLQDRGPEDVFESVADGSAGEIRGCLDQLDGRDRMWAEAAVIAALERAEYSCDVSSHFGLDSDPYLHFTSPLRRYPDLWVHRAVKAHLAGREYMVSQPERLAKSLTWSAQAAGRAEGAQRKRLWAVLYSGGGRGHVPHQTLGTVIWVNSFTVGVRSVATGVIVCARTRPDCKVDDDGNVFFDGEQVTLGSSVTVKVTDVDPLTGELTGRLTTL